jgi:hypothetical protein
VAAGCWSGDENGNVFLDVEESEVKSNAASVRNMPKFGAKETMRLWDESARKEGRVCCSLLRMISSFAVVGLVAGGNEMRLET